MIMMNIWDISGNTLIIGWPLRVYSNKIYRNQKSNNRENTVFRRLEDFYCVKV